MVMELRVANFATSKHLVVKGTIFPHHDIHKYTWAFSEGKTHNQIDHIWQTEDSIQYTWCLIFQSGWLWYWLYLVVAKLKTGSGQMNYKEDLCGEFQPKEVKWGAS
jgi:hypothetical protein